MEPKSRPLPQEPYDDYGQWSISEKVVQKPSSTVPRAPLWVYIAIYVTFFAIQAAVTYTGVRWAIRGRR